MQRNEGVAQSDDENTTGLQNKYRENMNGTNLRQHGGGLRNGHNDRHDAGGANDQ